MPNSKDSFANCHPENEAILIETKRENCINRKPALAKSQNRKGKMHKH